MLLAPTSPHSMSSFLICFSSAWHGIIIIAGRPKQEQFSRCGQTFRYRKLLFSLAWFHAILLERRKFKSLGFNVPYEFNESDFSICHDLVIVFLDEVRLFGQGLLYRILSYARILSIPYHSQVFEGTKLLLRGHP